ncbi:MAG: stage II sporulation protein E, partial [Planctomycetota bacterium]
MTSKVTAVSWQDKLRIVNELMKDVSRQTDAQELIKIYSRGVRQMMPVDRMVSMSRRGLKAPSYRVTRFSGWTEEINPWEQPEKLPLLQGGMLGKLLYGATPEVITRLEVDPDDPGYEYVKGVEAMLVMPQYENGEALNCTILMWEDADELPHADFPNILWQSNLFGRTTANLVLGKELNRAYNALDRELRAVGEIQRSLLPAVLPSIPGLALAARYETSQQAGGDY